MSYFCSFHPDGTEAWCHASVPWGVPGGTAAHKTQCSESIAAIVSRMSTCCIDVRHPNPHTILMKGVTGRMECLHNARSCAIKPYWEFSGVDDCGMGLSFSRWQRYGIVFYGIALHILWDGLRYRMAKTHRMPCLMCASGKWAQISHPILSCTKKP